MEQLPRRPVLLAKLKLLTPNTAGNKNYDAVMEYVLDKTLSDVANYCHIDLTDLPEQLDGTIVAMCLQFVDTHQLLVPIDEQTGDVESISEGDTSVKFKSPSQVYSELQAVNMISDNYVMQLNSFRRVKR